MNVAEDVLTVLSSAIVEGRSLTLAGQLDRKLYERTNEVLEAAGGRWNRKAKAHLFEEDPADVIDRVILTGTITVAQDFGYFPSPPAVVAELIARAQLAPGMHVLEPSAGQGAIVAAIPRDCRVHCIELLDRNIDKLVAKCGGPGRSFSAADFLTTTPERSFDRVVMNPPFAKQADIHHVMHARRFLKPDGHLVSVMAAGVTFRTDKLSALFRELVSDGGGSFEPLPDGSFKASGTGVRTVIVTLPAVSS